ncbi:ABC transporter permease subunit [Rossellomorea oryzaecorticis]|uniref:ABC transporter permease subunit n=1 Tax=Rossellomorea oryzaecorticis TaxID=1396505 RepID=A0ABW8VTC2_9BACI
MTRRKWIITLAKMTAEILTTSLMIAAIISFSQTYLLLWKPHWFQAFFLNLKELLVSVINMADIRVRVSDYQNQNLLEALAEPYMYSAKVLLSVLIVSIIAGLGLSVMTALLPKKIQSAIKEAAFFFESIPDVIALFSIQLIIIWIFKKSAILLVNPVGYMENIYLLPIAATSIIPSVILFQMTFFAIREEQNKPYVEFAASKGLTRLKVLTSHIFRNVCVVVFSNIQMILWMTLSNLLITEYVFNMKGIFSFMFRHLGSPEVLASCLLLIFIPFYFIEYAGRFISARMAGQGGRIKW